MPEPAAGLAVFAVPPPPPFVQKLGLARYLVDRRLRSRNGVEDGHEDGGLRGPAELFVEAIRQFADNGGVIIADLARGVRLKVFV
jgi:hypothetical protein